MADTAMMRRWEFSSRIQGCWIVQAQLLYGCQSVQIHATAPLHQGMLWGLVCALLHAQSPAHNQTLRAPPAGPTRAYAPLHTAHERLLRWQNHQPHPEE